MGDGKEMKKVGGWGRLNKYAMREISALQNWRQKCYCYPSRYPESWIMTLEKKHSRLNISTSCWYIYYFTEATIIKIVYDDRHILWSPLIICYDCGPINCDRGDEAINTFKTGPVFYGYIP